MSQQPVSYRILLYGNRKQQCENSEEVVVHINRVVHTATVSWYDDIQGKLYITAAT